MIVQPRDGRLLLIRQTDHAELAAALAEHWGNDTFARPSPREPVVAAARHHDDGWLLWEAAPRLDPATRRPYQFTHLPVAEHVGFYKAGIERVLALAPYAGLLTVLHLAGLYQRRFGTDPSIPLRELPPDEDRARRQLLDDLRRRQDELLRDLPRQGVPSAWLGERLLWGNYKLLQVYDRLSLYFCVGPPRPSALEPAPLDYEGGETRLTLQPLTERTVAVTPYPFDRDPLPLTVRAAVVPDRDYADDDDFRAAFAEAPVSELVFEVCKG